jgi:hypothetical protein
VRSRDWGTICLRRRLENRRVVWDWLAGLSAWCRLGLGTGWGWSLRFCSFPFRAGPGSRDVETAAAAPAAAGSGGEGGGEGVNVERLENVRCESEELDRAWRGRSGGRFRSAGWGTVCWMRESRLLKLSVIHSRQQQPIKNRCAWSK